MREELANLRGLVKDTTLPEPAEGSMRNVEDDLLLEKVKLERLQRKVNALTPMSSSKNTLPSRADKVRRDKLRGSDFLSCRLIASETPLLVFILVNVVVAALCSCARDTPLT